MEVTNVIELVTTLNHLKGKHIKAMLSTLETKKKLDPEVRKVILDGMNNFARDIYGALGYDVER